jgi:hypothetical protein
MGGHISKGVVRVVRGRQGSSGAVRADASWTFLARVDDTAAMTLARVLGPSLAAAGAVLLVAACLVSQNGSPSLFDGGSLGPCDGNLARQIPVTECPGCSSEDGGTAYAQCNGTSYNDCTCEITCGFTLVDDQGKPVDGGPRGQTLTNQEPQGSCCGLVAEEMPASACFGCTGDKAYAVCDDHQLLTCACACDLPKGYTLIDGGDDAANLCGGD